MLWRKEEVTGQVGQATGQVAGQAGTKLGTKLGPSYRSSRTSYRCSSRTSRDQVEAVLKSCYVAMSITEIMEIIGVTNRTKFRRKYIIPLIGEELLAMSIPDKPNSSLQKYYTTEKGKLLCQDEDEK